MPAWPYILVGACTEPIMMATDQHPVRKLNRILLFSFLLFASLYYARSVLITLTLGALLAMLLAPLSIRMERKGLHRALAALICVFILLASVSLIVFLLSWQSASLVNDLGNLQQKITDQIERLRQMISSNFGISQQQQRQMMEQQQGQSSGKVASMATGLLNGLVGVVTQGVLTLVYIFLFIFYRDHLQQFALKLVPGGRKPAASEAMQRIGKVAQHYITGLAMMIGCLWILYGIGFTIVGVKHALFFAMLCGLLEIVPFIGNITGTTITALMALSQGGTGTAAGVLVCYFIIQTVQTYLLEPLVVGSEVNINPLFTILILVVGEMVWGIPGMILAIPVLGIIKIICDTVPEWKPYGYLLGQPIREKEGSKITDKIKGWFQK
jgi:predicted PurR-regulated permease PerM